MDVCARLMKNVSTRAALGSAWLVSVSAALFSVNAQAFTADDVAAGQAPSLKLETTPKPKHYSNKKFSACPPKCNGCTTNFSTAIS